MHILLAAVTVPAVMAVTGASVIMISKAGGNRARRHIREMKGMFCDESENR